MASSRQGICVRRRQARSLRTRAILWAVCCVPSMTAAALGIATTNPAKPDSGPSAWDGAVEREVGSALRAAVASGRDSAGVLVFVRDGQVRIAEGFGFEDPGHVPVTAKESRFILNSISKTFVAVALAQLKTRARIASYDAPANRYLKTYRLPDSGGHEITLKDLATHSAGIDEAVFGMESAWPNPGPPRRVDYLAHPPQYFVAPGLLSVYSELDIDLLGLAVADTVDEPYADYVKREILTPFGMTKTSVGYPTGSYRYIPIPHLVTAYQPNAAENVEQLLYSTPMTLPDGGVISTGEDMGRFIIELNRGPYSDVFQIQRALDPRSVAYGLVFEITRVHDSLIAYHRGGGRGTNCMLAIVPAARAGIFDCATTIKPLRGTPADRQPVPRDTLDLAVFDSLGVGLTPDARAIAAQGRTSSGGSWAGYIGDYVGMSRHHLGIGRLRWLLHPYGVHVRNGVAGLEIDGVDGFRELSPGHFGAPGALETFTFVKSPVDGRILLSRSLDATPYEKPRPWDNPVLVDTLLAMFVAIAATGLVAPCWPRSARDSAVRIAASALAVSTLGEVAVLYGFHTFGFRYSVGIAWPVHVIRASAFLLIPIAGVLVYSLLKARRGEHAAPTIQRLHLAMLAIDAVAGVGLLTSVGVIGFTTQ